MLTDGHTIRHLQRERNRLRTNPRRVAWFVSRLVRRMVRWKEADKRPHHTPKPRCSQRGFARTIRPTENDRQSLPDAFDA